MIAVSSEAQGWREQILQTLTKFRNSRQDICEHNGRHPVETLQAIAHWKGLRQSDNASWKLFDEWNWEDFADGKSQRSISWQDTKKEIQSEVGIPFPYYFLLDNLTTYNLHLNYN